MTLAEIQNGRRRLESMTRPRKTVLRVSVTFNVLICQMRQHDSAGLQKVLHSYLASETVCWGYEEVRQLQMWPAELPSLIRAVKYASLHIK